MLQHQHKNLKLGQWVLRHLGVKGIFPKQVILCQIISQCFSHGQSDISQLLEVIGL